MVSARKLPGIAPMKVLRAIALMRGQQDKGVAGRGTPNRTWSVVTD